MNNKNDKSELHNILDLLVDSRKGYLKAAERVEEPGVKSLLVALADERVALERAVTGELHTQDPGTELDKDGTVKGDLHRAWMELRDALSSSDNANVLSECERGEAYLIMRYDEVLEKDGLLTGTRLLATHQRAEVQGNLARIKQLRKSFEKIES